MGSTHFFLKYGLLFSLSATLSFATLAYFVSSPIVTNAAPPLVENTIFLTGSGTWEVPDDWNSANNSIHVIGGGAGGKKGMSAQSGGGGAYSGVTNLNLTPGASVTYSAGSGATANSGGNGGDSWFNASSFAACTSSATCVRAQGGKGSTGGSSSQGVGIVTSSGGNNGGGAGTPSGDGPSNGGGSTQSLWVESGTGETAGPGKGGKVGGSSQSSAGSGGAGQSYGGGGGAGGCVTSNGGACNNTSFGNGGAGAPGIVVIKYFGQLKVSVETEENSCLGSSGELVVYRNGPPTHAAVSGTIVLGGSAVSGMDYQPINTSFTIPANQFSVSIPVNSLSRNTMGKRVLEVSVEPSPNYRVEEGTEMEIENSALPPIFEELDDYEPADFVQYPIPDTRGGRPRGLPDVTRLAWYASMPSPGLCSSSSYEEGMCRTNSFDSTQGFRIMALTATPDFVQGELETGGVGIDLVSHNRENACGEEAVRWSYVMPEPETYLVPKYTPLTISYACQPNQDYAWTTDTDCFLGIGSCNVADHNIIFRTADRAKVDGQPAPALFDQKQITLSDEETFTLQCGGFRPEDGSEVTEGEPPIVDSTNIRRSGDWFRDHPDTYGFINEADPSFYHPPVTLTVQACSADDEVVREGDCVPCSTLVPGSHRSGNMCVTENMPTATLSANNAPDGQQVTVNPGEEVAIVGNFTAATGDTLTGTAINDNATGVSVPCGQVTPGGSSCWTKPDPQKTYKFTPSESDVGETFTFSAQIKTSAYPNYNSYKTVSVKVGGGAVCPTNATTNPDGSCTCTQQYYAWTGSTCALFCPATMQADGSGSCVPSAPPLPTDITFTATRVRSGQPSILAWSINSMAVGVTCTISPTPASGQIVWDGSSTWTDSTQTQPITQSTLYTLTCSNGVDAPISRTATANLIPSFEEI